MKKKYIYFIIILLIAINSFSQRHISNNEDGSVYISLGLYRDVFKKNISIKDLKNLKINGQDTLILIENFEKFKNKISRKSNFKSESRAYMSLKSYKTRYKKPLTKNDTLNFKFKDNDTLVLVKDYKPIGVSVPYEEVDSTFLEIYKDIVYKKHSGGKNKKKLTMRYWKGEIKIYFNKKVDKKVKNEIKKFANQITTEIDSLKISFVKDLEKSNYIIYAIDSNKDYKYEKRIKTKNSGYYLFWNGKQQIYDCKFEINSNSYANTEYMIKHVKILFIETLGNFHFSSLLNRDDYLSSYYSKNKEFSNRDLQLLKYHYSYGICKGTDLETFEGQHKKAQKTIQDGGKVNFRHLY